MKSSHDDSQRLTALGTEVALHQPVTGAIAKALDGYSATGWATGVLMGVARKVTRIDIA
jgi:hypothetical protein